MIKRVVVILGVVGAMLSVSAHAQENILGQIGGRLFGALVGAAVDGAGTVLREATKESPQEKAVREREDIERLADQMLEGYPEDQRAQLRPQLLEKLTLTQAQYAAAASRAESIRVEQQGIGAMAVTVLSAPVGNRQVFDAAERAARMRTGGNVVSNVQSGAQIVRAGVFLARIFGGGGGPAVPHEKASEPTLVVSE